MKGVLGLIGLVEGLAGPGAFEHALRAADEIMEAFIEQDDRDAGRTGRLVPRGAAPLAVAMHSVNQPRARFCRRMCRGMP